MSHYKPEMDPIFDAEEWQIKVSPAVIEAGPDAATYSVNVSSKAQWKVESNASWCKVSRQGNQAIVKVDAYQGTETRSCNVEITTQTYTPEISPAHLPLSSKAYFSNCLNLNYHSNRKALPWHIRIH